MKRNTIRIDKRYSCACYIRWLRATARMCGTLQIKTNLNNEHISWLALARFGYCIQPYRDICADAGLGSYLNCP